MNLGEVVRVWIVEPLDDPLEATEPEEQAEAPAEQEPALARA